MGITVGHAKVVTIADGTDTNLVRVTDWNSVHAVTLNLAGGEVIKYLQAGTNSVSSGTVSFADGGGVTFGMATDGIITGSVKTDYLTTAAQVSHSHAFATTTTNGSQVVVGTSNSNGVTIGVPAYLTTTAAQSVQPVAYAAGGTTNNFSTLAFANSNGLSWSTGANGIFPGTAVLTTAAQVSHSHGNPTLALTGIAGTTASASNGLTLSLSALAGSDTWYATGANTIAGTNTSGTFVNDQYILSGAGAISVGVSNNTVIISGAGGGGTTNQTGPNIAAPGVTVTAGTVVFSNSGGVTFGMAGSVMTASAPGGGGVTLSRWLAPDGGMSSLSSHPATAHNGTILLGMVQIPNYVSATKVGIVQGHLVVTSYNTSQAASMTIDIGIYGRMNSSAISLMSSGNTSYMASWSSSSTTGVMGMRELYVPMDVNLTPGIYYVAKRMSITGNNASAATAHTISHFGVPMQTAISAAGDGFGVATAASNAAVIPFHGMFSVTSGAFPATIGLTDMVHTGTALMFANYWKEFQG